jgi:hypothetical protein
MAERYSGSESERIHRVPFIAQDDKQILSNRSELSTLSNQYHRRSSLTIHVFVVCAPAIVADGFRIARSGMSHISVS